MEPAPPEIIKSLRERPKLVYDGYAYNKLSHKNLYRCVDECGGYAKFDEVNKIVTVTKPHEDHGQNERIHWQLRRKRKASRSEGTPSTPQLPSTQLKAAKITLTTANTLKNPIDHSSASSANAVALTTYNTLNHLDKPTQTSGECTSNSVLPSTEYWQAYDMLTDEWTMMCKKLTPKLNAMPFDAFSIAVSLLKTNEVQSKLVSIFDGTQQINIPTEPVLQHGGGYTQPVDQITRIQTEARGLYQQKNHSGMQLRRKNHLVDNACDNLLATHYAATKLISLNLEGIATFIRTRKPKIVFMVGAGISTNAGIPDFRSPGTGLYDNLAQYNLPSADSIFELDFFKTNPEPFFSVACELFQEKFLPTLTHYFIRLVEKKEMLQRCFTQNIDGLEAKVGLSKEGVIMAHGSHSTSTCLNCDRKYGYLWLMRHLQDNKGKAAYCTACKTGLVKPDVLFFGEPLSKKFYKRVNEDMPGCTVLIIMGTSLKMDPFATLVSKVPTNTPRLLVNMTPVREDVFDFDGDNNKRDVFWQGDCDACVRELATMLGWSKELADLTETL